MVGLKELALQQKSKLVLMAVFSVLSGVTIIGQSYLIVTIIDRVFLKGAHFLRLCRCWSDCYVHSF